MGYCFIPINERQRSMTSMEFDTSKTGLRAVLKDWQEIALNVLWESNKGLGSKKVWDEVNARLQGETISRASIINFLDAMKEMGVLGGTDTTGKGGHRWIYSPAMSQAQFKLFVAETILGNLLRDFPEETQKALRIIN